ncbi:MAG: hypothetical protein R3Y38_04145 [Rikenellaceae bacterium]
MKRFIAALILNILMLSCANVQKWSKHEIEDFKTKLKGVENLDYLHNMQVDEYNLLVNNLAHAIEIFNPRYEVFINLPSAKDTINTYVISFLSYHLDAQTRNLRSLFPYRHLVKEGILPEGMSHNSKDEFYLCLENKLRARYKSMEFFLGALSYGDDALIQAKIYMRECFEQM